MALGALSLATAHSFLGIALIFLKAVAMILEGLVARVWLRRAPWSSVGIEALGANGSGALATSSFPAAIGSLLLGLGAL